MKKVFLYISSLFLFSLFILNTEYSYSAPQPFTVGDYTMVTWSTTDIIPGSCVYYSSSTIPTVKLGSDYGVSAYVLGGEDAPGWPIGVAPDNNLVGLSLHLTKAGTYDFGVKCTGNNIAGDVLLSFSTVDISCPSGKTWDTNTQSCVLPSGSISSLPSCEISVGQSSCNVDLSWQTFFPIDTSILKTNFPANGTVLDNLNNGTTSVSVNGASQTYHLYNNGNQIATTEITTSCVSGSSWNGSTCVLPSGIISSSVPSCEIPLGASKCNVNLTWGTSYPVGTSVVTSGSVLYTLNEGTDKAVDVNGPGQVYRLTNNGNEIASTTVTTTCPANSGWFGGKCNSYPSPPTIYGAIYPRLNTSYDYDFIGSDTDLDSVRYGIDWGSGPGLNGPVDGIADEWIPVSYSSYLTQTTSHTWTLTQTGKVFKALTQDLYGQNSEWASYTISTQIDGVCGGSNNKTFSNAPTTDLCVSGDVSPMSSLGTSWTWTCNGVNSGVNSPQCRAIKDAVPVVSATIAPETCIKSGWNLNSLSYSSTNASYCEVSTLGSKVEFLDDPDNDPNTNPNDYRWPTSNTWYKPGPYYANQSWTFKCYNGSGVVGNSVIKSLSVCANPPPPLPIVNINPSDLQNAIVNQTLRFSSNAGSSNSALTHHYFDIKYPNDTNFTENVGKAPVLSGVRNHDSFYDFKPTRAGRYFIRAAAKDSINNIWVYTEEVEIIINDPVNPPPTVTITPTTDQTMYKGSRIALSSLAKDTFNDVVQHRIDYLPPGKENIPSNWMLDASRAGTIPATGNHTLNYSFIPSVTGDYLIRATAKDRVNPEVYSSTLKLTVRSNPSVFEPQPPTVNIAPNVSPKTIKINESIVFTSTALSNDSILQQHHIDYQKDGIWSYALGNSVSNLVNAESNQVTYIFNPSATGTYYIQAGAKDSVNTNWVNTSFVVVNVTEVIQPTDTCKSNDVKKYTSPQFSDLSLDDLCSTDYFPELLTPDLPDVAGIINTIRSNFDPVFTDPDPTDTDDVEEWTWGCADGTDGAGSSCKAERVVPKIDFTVE